MSKLTNHKYHKTKEEIQLESEIIQVAKSDPEKFEKLYDDYYPQILNYVYLRLDDKDLAIDVTQQTFLKALKNLNKYEHRGLPFSSWLYRIASNELNLVFRKNGKLKTININDSIATVLQQEVADENLSEWIFKLKTILKTLQESDFRIIELRFFEHRPFAEIGEILEITENNAKVKTYRILEKLKVKLNELKH